MKTIQELQEEIVQIDRVLTILRQKPAFVIQLHDQTNFLDSVDLYSTNKDNIEYANLILSTTRDYYLKKREKVSKLLTILNKGIL